MKKKLFNMDGLNVNREELIILNTTQRTLLKKPQNRQD